MQYSSNWKTSTANSQRILTELDFTFALNKYKQTGDVRELFYVRKFAQMILAGNY